MTRTVKIIGLLLIIAIAATGCRFAHRRMIEHAKMKKTDKTMESRQMRGMDRGQMGQRGQFMFHGPMRGMHGNNAQGQMPGMRGRMGQGQGFGMRRGMGPMGRGQMRQGQMGPNMMMGRIPNLTDKQRKDIQDLQLKQMQEADKLREETAAKMQSMRETGRSKLMNILTDEQKKFLESGPRAAQPASPPVTKQ